MPFDTLVVCVGNLQALEKCPKIYFFVVPTEAGIRLIWTFLDAGAGPAGSSGTFYDFINLAFERKGRRLDATVENIEKAAASSPSRIESFDVLKAGLTLLVVLHHTAITYGASGEWFYREVQGSASVQSVALTYFCAVNQAYFMGFFFLLAGYFTPASLERKGAAAFLRDRMVRLGIPLLFFGFVVGPLTVAIAQAAKGADIFQTLFAQWRHGAFVLGPLWFVQTLLLFSIVFVAVHFAGGGNRARFRQNTLQKDRATYPTAKTMLAAAVLTGAAAFVVRLYMPVGKSLWGMQLGYYPSYVVLFFVGCLAANGQRLEGIPEDRVRATKIVAWAALPLLLPLIVLALRYPVIGERVLGGWNLSAFLYAMWEPLIALGIIAALLAYSLRRFRTAPPFLHRFSRRAYCVYIIHPVVLVLVGVALREAALPALVKFALAGSIACFFSYVLAGLLLRVAVLRQIL